MIIDLLLREKNYVVGGQNANCVQVSCVCPASEKHIIKSCVQGAGTGMAIASSFFSNAGNLEAPTKVAWLLIGGITGCVASMVAECSK